MKKIANGFYRQVTKRKTKSGVKEYVYYYREVTPSKAGKKRAFEKVSIAIAKRQEAVKKEQLDTLLSGISDWVIKKQVENQIKEHPEYSLQKVAQMIESEVLDKQQQFIRNLGYTEEEFAEEFGLTAEDLRQGKFETEKDSGLIKFTDKNGLIFYFSWDYDKGLIRVK